MDIKYHHEKTLNKYKLFKVISKEYYFVALFQIQESSTFAFLLLVRYYFILKIEIIVFLF